MYFSKKGYAALAAQKKMYMCLYTKYTRSIQYTKVYIHLYMKVRMGLKREK
jgi:hypothetical protein